MKKPAAAAVENKYTKGSQEGYNTNYLVNWLDNLWENKTRK